MYRGPGVLVITQCHLQVFCDWRNMMILCQFTNEYFASLPMSTPRNLELSAKSSLRPSVDICNTCYGEFSVVNICDLCHANARYWYCDVIFVYVVLARANWHKVDIHGEILLEATPSSVTTIIAVWGQIQIQVYNAEGQWISRHAMRRGHQCTHYYTWALLWHRTSACKQWNQNFRTNRFVSTLLCS